MKSAISKSPFYYYISLILFGSLFALNLAATPVNKGDSCRSVYGSDVYLSKSIESIILQPFSIPIKSENGIFSIPSDNPFISQNGNQPVLRPVGGAVARLVTNRSPEAQQAIDDKSTTMLGRSYGMGFKDKKGNPFDVRVNGIPLTIEKKKFDSLVQGMQPTLELMRKTLQTFMSNPNAPASAYPFKHLNESEIQYIINEMKNSPYFDPSIPNKALADYNFGAVYGVDATFGKLENHLNHIFEINAGTPSGLSNMTLIFEVLRQTDPKMFDTIVAGLSKNEAFKKLRDTMDGHGKALISDGLSVELGTGIYNGAHPDVSMISHFSGMPLVERSDLFIDRDGFVRLTKKVPVVDGVYVLGDKRVKHVGAKEYEGYPQVWSIYSRSEEGNAVQQNTTTSGKGRVSHPGVGIKLPNVVEINNELNKRFPKLNLQPGVAYLYKKDRFGKAYAVHKDAEGKPMVEPNYDQFGSDPVYSNNTGATLLQSLFQKKVYLSNLGTRLIDHKGILSLVTKEVQEGAREQGLDPVKTIVSPPPELRGAENLGPFYQTPRKYVVKVPDESGGSGVDILPTATDFRIETVINMVRNNPLRYVVQETADFMSVISVSQVNGKPTYVTRANDGRVFIYFDANGKAVSDPWAVLMRVADYMKLSTNTSQGAQYGWLKVGLEDNSVYFSKDRSTFPKAKLSVITSSQSFHLKDYLISIDMILNGYLENPNNNGQLFLSNFWNSARTLMPVLGPDFSYVVSAIESMRAENPSISKKDFVKIISNLKERIRMDQLDPLIKAEVDAYDVGNGNHVIHGSSTPVTTDMAQ